MDAIASPFVEGQLWRKKVSAVLETECACCGRGIRVELDGELATEPEARPLSFFPMVDFKRWRDPSIVDGF